MTVEDVAKPGIGVTPVAVAPVTPTVTPGLTLPPVLTLLAFWLVFSVLFAVPVSRIPPPAWTTAGVDWLGGVSVTT
jgi:hypothetical protein